jgi:coenzyme F420-0:L-glutamate ligase/coenzyme F420-1:gamma-L-glutamate ligase
MKVPRIEVTGVTGIPEVRPGDQLGRMIVDAARNQETPVENGDVLIVTQKIVSKAENMLVDLNTIEPSRFARSFAEPTGKDARLVELVLRESRAIVRMDPDRGIIISETRHGFVCANAGIDASNIPGDDQVCLLPVNPDASAQAIREKIREETGGADVAVIISDTFGRAWREGHVNFAIGVAGINPILDYRGTIDASGKMLHVTSIAIADELASTAELVTAKSINVPVAIVRGYDYPRDEYGTGILIRDRSRDFFR